MSLLHRNRMAVWQLCRPKSTSRMCTGLPRIVWATQHEQDFMKRHELPLSG